MGNLRLGSPAALLRNPGSAVCSQEEGSSSSEINCTEITSAVVVLIVRTQLPRCKLSVELWNVVATTLDDGEQLWGVAERWCDLTHPVMRPP